MGLPKRTDVDVLRVDTQRQRLANEVGSEWNVVRFVADERERARTFELAKTVDERAVDIRFEDLIDAAQMQHGVVIDVSFEARAHPHEALSAATFVHRHFCLRSPSIDVRRLRPRVKTGSLRRIAPAILPSSFVLIRIV